MRPHLKISVGILILGIPVGTAAQTGTQSSAQPPAQTQTQQGTQTTPPATQTQQGTQTTPPDTGTQPSTDTTPADTATQQSIQLKPATAADVKAGVAVVDKDGGLVGKVDSVDSEGVVISTGSVRAKVPLASLGVGGKVLTVSLSKAELEAAAKKKEAQPKQEKPK
jgi:hypothetical protein